MMGAEQRAFSSGPTLSGILKRTGSELQYRQTAKAHQPCPSQTGPTRGHIQQDRHAADHGHHEQGENFHLT